MCGICGFAGKRHITIEELQRMNQTMIHRGPDDHGEEIYPLGAEETVGLAQRRLSIIDLSPLGHQPMHSADGRVSLVFNGEIYNFQQLKQELSDYPFVSACDTEVILAAYLKWGIDVISHLNGMFALAIFDRSSGELYLARDRVGKKPLYYWLENENLVFASELKPIMACPGFAGKVQREVLPRFLYQQYLAGEKTIFEQVYRVMPGEIVRFKSGETRKWLYWDLPEVYHEKCQTPPESYEQALDKLEDLLQSAVKERLVADVPIGTFLSGGYDSSLVTALAQSMSEGPVKTFSIGFSDACYDEAKYAAEVAGYLGCDHTERYIDEQDMFRLVDSIPKYYDEPFADSSQIPSMLVSELAKSKVTVALSGDGGDEFFCGYSIYDRVAQAQKLDFLGTLVGGCFDALHITDRLPFKVRVIAENRNPETKTQFPGGNYLRIAREMVEMPEAAEKNRFLPCLYEYESKFKEKNWQERRMLLDMNTYLPEDILCKVDRASMKYSLETRCPILDTRVMEYAFCLPHDFKYRKGTKKRILKDLAYRYLPVELLDRPKSGFSVPLDSWLRGPLKEQVLSFGEKEFLRRQGIFDAAFTTSFLQDYLDKGDAGRGTGENYSRIVWAFLMFQKWYEEYVA